MALIDMELDEEMYHETTVLPKRKLSDDILKEPLKNVNPHPAICVNLGTSMQEVVDLMREQKRGCVIIVEAGKRKPIGIFTERDLLMRVAGRGWDFRKHTIDEVMSKNPASLTLNDQLGYALNKMVAQGYRHLPIVTEEGNVYGMVTVRSLLEYISEYFPENVINQPPGSQDPCDRDGG